MPLNGDIATMWRDPYGHGIGERIVLGLASLLAMVVAIRLAAAVLTPLVPVLVTAVLLGALALWFSRRRFF